MTEGGLSAQERAAVKQRAAELRAEKAAAKRADKVAAGRAQLEAAIAEMPDDEQAIARRIDAIVTRVAPRLVPGTMYGAPAYKTAEGRTVLFFRSGAKDKYRYSTLSFQPDATLDDGGMWATSFAVTSLSTKDEELIESLVRRATAWPNPSAVGQAGPRACLDWTTRAPGP